MTTTIAAIQKAVVDHYGLRHGDMVRQDRRRIITRPRQVAMYLCKLYTDASLPQIGRAFGGRHHTTVIHARAQIAHLQQNDELLALDIKTITRSLFT